MRSSIRLRTAKVDAEMLDESEIEHWSAKDLIAQITKPLSKTSVNNVAIR